MKLYNKDRVKQLSDRILREETKGLNINDKTRNNLAFSYDDVEGMFAKLIKKLT